MYTGPPTHECVCCGKQVCWHPGMTCGSCQSELAVGWRKLLVYLGKWARFEERFGPNP